MSTYALIGLAAAASAAVLELPVVIQNTYASVVFDIGTPAKPYRLSFDTGSSTSWLTGRNCTDSTCPNRSGFVRTPYNDADSSSSFALDSSGNVGYIDGNGVNGLVFQDVFSDENGTIAWKQTFLAAVDVTDEAFLAADGLLGLAFSSIGVENTTTLVETLIWDDKLDDPRFAVFYGTNLNDTGAQDGVLTIGGSHEDTYVDGEVTYVPLRLEDPYEVWRAPLRSINVLFAQDGAIVSTHNGKAPTTNATAGTWPKANTTWPLYGTGFAVFDTGAGMISLPSQLLEPVYFNLGWNLSKLYSGEEQFGCEDFNSTWALSFTFGEDEDESNDVTFSIRGDEIWAPLEQCMPPFGDSGSDDFALVGASFLRRFYSIFEFGGKSVETYKPRVGFGKLKEEYDYLNY
ncbi:6e2cc3e0-2c58-4840-9184-f7364ce7e4de [Sclerotinia trifoliorum]|uniref:6e2cc3e0-2c58-4840-9184-f7364ce7e4de n=1 Tax=Sclerotinia trifoliorum TaxID=28548 RepID=A0A8H2ZPD3_9HELO|nr:6e2cc3e0-2c58-4840-9184-f7364ce7e4de [Sclerotinia trifoliorum]